MNGHHWQKVEAIVDQALELPQDQRESFIQGQCGENKQLKSEVTELLESIFDSEGWLDDPNQYKEELYQDISEDVESLSAHHSLLGKTVGSYTIEEQIGEGGMGAVYRAKRTDGTFEHEVAIKIIRQGRATDANIKRFEREQRILAGLNHPGIARLFDGGVTEDGFPYIIMEYVDGIPIDDFCNRNDCSVDDQLDLFQQVLKAVRYAHENLVIHRDLKPANILVTEDGDIKILDFGISKLLEQEEETSSLTQTGARLLTPRYAAPEQITQENITTATDLYALGIVLYQLLANANPYDFEDASRYEIEQIIVGEDAPKPSSKTSKPAIRRRLKGDLDAIILKAIRKDPAERYRVASEWIDDLKHYRNGLPVAAHAGSLQYRSKKFISRHKLGIAVAFFFIAFSIVFTLIHTSRITRERNNAQLEAQKATQITNLLNGILQQSNPFAQPDRDITLAEVLDDGVEKIQNELEDQPQIKAELLGLIGENYASLGNFSKGEELLKNALDLYSPSELESTKQTYINNLNRIGSIYHLTGRFQEAEESYLKALEIVKRQEDEPSLIVGSLYNSLAMIYQEQGKLLKTETFYKQAIAIADSTQKFELSTMVGNLANAYRSQGAFEKAVDLHKQSIDLMRENKDTLHPNMASAYNSLAFTYQQKGDFLKADSLHQIALSMRQELFPPDHHHIASSLIRLGLLKIKQFHTREAEQYLKEGYDILSSKFPSSHWQVLSAKGGLAVSRALQGQFEKNIPIVEEVYQKFVDKFGTDDWRSQEAASALTNLYRAWGKPEQANYYSSKE